MSVYLTLFWEFFKTGLFAVGGGMATLPFLKEIGETQGWYTYGELMNMLAISESTPGPIGINMATYVGFQTAGVIGAITATLGIITPSIIVIILIAQMLSKFRQSRLVDSVFQGLRPASTALIAAACVSVAISIFINVGGTTEHTFSVHWLSVALSLALFWAMQSKKFKKLHPFAFIGVAAVLGILLKL